MTQQKRKKKMTSTTPKTHIMKMKDNKMKLLMNFQCHS
jgi:hypothetical protein